MGPEPWHRAWNTDPGSPVPGADVASLIHRRQHGSDELAFTEGALLLLLGKQQHSRDYLLPTPWCRVIAQLVPVWM